MLVFVCSGEAEEAEKIFSLRLGCKRSGEQWLKELNEQPSAKCDPSVSTSTFSATRQKITVEDPLEDLESENTETWQKLCGHAIVGSEIRQEKIKVHLTPR